MTGAGRLIAALVVAWAGVAAGPLRAQDAAPRQETVSVFLDCQTFGCDFDFFRTEIEWVNWVRDREVADVHLLVTGQATGGGGRLYELSFLGRDGFEGESRELTFTSTVNATGDEVRRGLMGVIARGLIPFVEGSPVADRLRIAYQAPPEGPEGGGEPPATDQADPWDYWVFTVRMNGFLMGESSVSSMNLSGSLNARRTTEAWKLSLSTSYGRRSTEYQLEDRTVESVVKDWGANGLVARSLGSHWSLGARVVAGSTTFRNQDLHLRLAPGLEYSVYPYAESTRRRLTLLWSLGASHWDYAEETLFGHTEETRFDQSLTAQLDLTQPWGRMSLFGEAAHYLHDSGLWRATLGGSMQVRLFKGFSLTASGNYSWIRDQLYIPAGSATDDEVLTRQRQLATAYNYYTSFGVSYTFGSIFNNVVNPRFGGGGGMVMFF